MEWHDWYQWKLQERIQNYHPVQVPSLNVPDHFRLILDTPFIRPIASVGRSPIGVVFGLLWNGGVLRVNVATLKARGVWDFTYNHEAAGSVVWLKPGFSSSSAQPSRPSIAKMGPKKSVRSGAIGRKKGVIRGWWVTVQNCARRKRTSIMCASNLPSLTVEYHEEGSQDLEQRWNGGQTF